MNRLFPEPGFAPHNASPSSSLHTEPDEEDEEDEEELEPEEGEKTDRFEDGEDEDDEDDELTQGIGFHRP